MCFGRVVIPIEKDEADRSAGVVHGSAAGTAAHYAEIVRLNAPDYRPSVESFDLSLALANPAAAPKLQQLDTVRIFSRYDFEPAPSVWIGARCAHRASIVRRPSTPARRDLSGGGVAPDASLIPRNCSVPRPMER